MDFPPPSEKQARVIWLAVTGLAIAVLVALMVGLVWGLGRVMDILSPVLWPLAMAGVLAYLLDPVVDFLEKKGLSRRKAIVGVFVLALLIAALIGSIVVPQIMVETRQLADKIPVYKVRLQDRAERWTSNSPTWLRMLVPHQPVAAPEPVPPRGGQPAEADPSTVASVHGDVPAAAESPQPPSSLAPTTLKSVTDLVAVVLPTAGNWLVRVFSIIATVFGIIAGLALVPVYAFYLLLEKRGIESSWTDCLPVADSKFKDELVFVLGSINGYLIAFFRGQVLVAICDAVLYTIGFLAIGLPYAVLIGATAVLLTMIPYLGAITLCAAALVVAVVQYGDWLHPLLVLCVFGVVQTLEGLVISPRIMGDRVELHPLAIIIAVVAGTTLLGGLLGGILAIPLAAVLRVVLARYVWKKHEA
jgi:predicted PurR-regulated permease PerM